VNNSHALDRRGAVIGGIKSHSRVERRSDNKSLCSGKTGRTPQVICWKVIVVIVGESNNRGVGRIDSSSNLILCTADETCFKRLDRVI
jgi:hypothetical protein